MPQEIQPILSRRGRESFLPGFGQGLSLCCGWRGSTFWPSDSSLRTNESQILVLMWPRVTVEGDYVLKVVVGIYDIDA